MTWIDTVPYQQATGRLKQLYDRIKGPDDNVDNIMMAHSLRPHTMDGHMTLYKYVLHHSANKVPKWFLEALGVLVSHLNGCAYCVEHHFTGMTRLLGDKARADAIRAALEAGDTAPFDARENAAIAYARALTKDPAGMSEPTLAAMREAGYSDGEILEINQVVAYFAYANRTVQGLGITTEGDIIGLSPGNSADPEDWSHR
ncbi:MAG: peroxidase-related enzyme [Pseudomonadota bacterium]